MITLTGRHVNPRTTHPNFFKDYRCRQIATFLKTCRCLILHPNLGERFEKVLAKQTFRSRLGFPVQPGRVFTSVRGFSLLKNKESRSCSQQTATVSRQTWHAFVRRINLNQRSLKPIYVTDENNCFFHFHFHGIPVEELGILIASLSSPVEVASSVQMTKTSPRMMMDRLRSKL